MKKRDLIEDFAWGRETESGKASNLYIEDGKLYNYSTIIALRKNNTLFLNENSYSMTTTTNQNIIRRLGVRYISVTEEQIKRLSHMDYDQDYVNYLAEIQGTSNAEVACSEVTE